MTDKLWFFVLKCTHQRGNGALDLGWLKWSRCPRASYYISVWQRRLKVAIGLCDKTLRRERTLKRVYIRHNNINIMYHLQVEKWGKNKKTNILRWHFAVYACIRDACVHDASVGHRRRIAYNIVQLQYSYYYCATDRCTVYIAVICIRLGILCSHVALCIITLRSLAHHFDPTSYVKCKYICMYVYKVDCVHGPAYNRMLWFIMRVWASRATGVHVRWYSVRCARSIFCRCTL